MWFHSPWNRARRMLTFASSSSLIFTTVLESVVTMAALTISPASVVVLLIHPESTLGPPFI